MRNILGITAVLFLLPGCASFQDWRYNCTNEMRSHRAWMGVAPDINSTFRPSHYGHGWKAGYFCVLTGGSGQPPLLPPHEYWAACYQNVDGQRDIQSWYRGFQAGATAAERDNASHFHYLRPFGMTAPYAPAIPYQATSTSAPSGVPAAPSVPAAISEESLPPLPSDVPAPADSSLFAPPDGKARATDGLSRRAKPIKNVGGAYRGQPQPLPPANATEEASDVVRLPPVPPVQPLARLADARSSNNSQFSSSILGLGLGN